MNKVSRPGSSGTSADGMSSCSHVGLGRIQKAGVVTPFGKEDHMFALLKNLVAEDAGQDLAEYGIALAVIGAFAAGAAVIIAGDVNTLWSRAQVVINSAV